MTPFSAVVVAAGKSARFGGVKKEYRYLGDRSVLELSLSVFLERDDCLACVAVVPPNGEGEARSFLSAAFLGRCGDRLLFAEGGAQRADSVLAGLLALVGRAGGIVLVHDAARPWASSALVDRVLAGTVSRGACIPGVPVTDTIKRIDRDGVVVGHPERSLLRAVQTPQGFAFEGLLQAYRSLGSAAVGITDDAEAWSLAGGAVLVVDGERQNVKITFPEDLP